VDLIEAQGWIVCPLEPVRLPVATEALPEQDEFSVGYLFECEVNGQAPWRTARDRDLVDVRRYLGAFRKHARVGKNLVRVESPRLEAIAVELEWSA